jgi:hypothetical protein
MVLTFQDTGGPDLIMRLFKPQSYTVPKLLFDLGPAGAAPDKNMSSFSCGRKPTAI